MALSDHLRAKDWTFSSTSRAAQRRNELALNILIASLAMFFAAAVFAYLLIRFGSDRELPEIRLPAILWLSTGLALAGGTFLRRAVEAVRRERQDLLRARLLAAFVLGAGFCLSQSVGLTFVLRDHLAVMKSRQGVSEDVRPQASIANRSGRALAEGRTPPADDVSPVRTSVKPPTEGRLEGLFFVLILLHALHFVAGMVALTVVTRRGLAGRYDHEYHAGVKLCARYWLFLDVVWVVLFAVLLTTTFDWPPFLARFSAA